MTFYMYHCMYYGAELTLNAWSKNEPKIIIFFFSGLGTIVCTITIYVVVVLLVF